VSNLPTQCLSDKIIQNKRVSNSTSKVIASVNDDLIIAQNDGFVKVVAINEENQFVPKKEFKITEDLIDDIIYLKENFYAVSYSNGKLLKLLINEDYGVLYLHAYKASDNAIKSLNYKNNYYIAGDDEGNLWKINETHEP